LEAGFEDCAAERAAHVVLVTAPAGMGKSRLRYELLLRLAARPEPPEVWIGMADELHAGAPYVLAATLLRCAIGAGPSDSIGDQRTKLRARIARDVASTDVERVVNYLSELGGMIEADTLESGVRAPQPDRHRMGELITKAWIDFVAGAV